jgi:hypothetical protein
MFKWDGDTRKLLSLLWIFLTVNYIFCDVFTLHYAPSLQQLLNGGSESIKITQEFLLYFSLIMEIPMIMILLSRYLVFKPNKYTNIVAALITGSVQAFTLSMGGTLHYKFFSLIEISIAIFILYIVIRWKPKNA